MCQMPNIWHTKHHLTPFIKCAISHFSATCYSKVTNLLQYGQVWHMDLLFFYSSFSLISLSVSPSNPNPLLSLTPILSSQTPTLTALPHQCWHRRWLWQSLPCQSLSSNGFSFFFFFFFCRGLMGGLGNGWI